MMMYNKNFISKLALGASFFALCVIALGAFTRLIDAGLGCPDWPGCYGQLTVPSSDAAITFLPSSHFIAYKAWAEMIHRYFVGALSFFIISIVFTILLNVFFSTEQNIGRRSNLIFAGMLILLLIYQIMLGRWTVTLKLLPIIVTQHLLGGFLILVTLWLIFLNNGTLPNKSTNIISAKRYLPWSLIALIILFSQIMLGAWTSTNYASLSCPDFPFCLNDQSILPLQFKEAFNIYSVPGVNYEGGVLTQSARQVIQMTHRLGALIFTLYMLIFAVFVIPKLKAIPKLVTPFYVILGLLCVQVCVGISNVIFKLPLITAIMHNVIAALLLLAVITFTFQISVFRSEVSS